MNEQPSSAYTQSGTLIVSVYTASGALPIEGAIVTVKGNEAADSDIIAVLYSDRSGNTEKISLPAPPIANSESPGMASPFAKYTIEVDRDGFNSRTFTNVPVFAGTTSIQPVNLIPKTEYEGQAIIPQGEYVTETQNPNL